MKTYAKQSAQVVRVIHQGEFLAGGFQSSNGFVAVLEDETQVMLAGRWAPAGARVGMFFGAILEDQFPDGRWLVTPSTHAVVARNVEEAEAKLRAAHEELQPAVVPVSTEVPVLQAA